MSKKKKKKRESKRRKLFSELRMQALVYPERKTGTFVEK